MRDVVQPLLQQSLRRVRSHSEPAAEREVALRGDTERESSCRTDSEERAAAEDSARREPQDRMAPAGQ